MNLGKNIYNLRKNKGLTQEQLADKINVTRQTISNWELGETYPNPEQLKLLSKLLDISIDDLIENESILKISKKQNPQEQIKNEIVLGIDIMCCVIWGIASLIAFIENNDITAIIYLCLCFMWMFIGSIWYLLKIKK